MVRASGASLASRDRGEWALGGKRKRGGEEGTKITGLQECKRKDGGPVPSAPDRAGVRQQLPAGPAAGDPGDHRRCGG